MVARRLCERARPGQISAPTWWPAPGGPARLRLLRPRAPGLKGVPKPVTAYEVRYEAEAAEEGIASQLPLVGREAELTRLSARLRRGGGRRRRAGHDPGRARHRQDPPHGRAVRAGLAGRGLRVAGRMLRGGVVAPLRSLRRGPGGPRGHRPARGATGRHGPGAGPIAQLVPAVREALPDVDDPQPLQPDEERFRLLDSVASFLLARSRRAPAGVPGRPPMGRQGHCGHAAPRRPPGAPRPSAGRGRLPGRRGGEDPGPGRRAGFAAPGGGVRPGEAGGPRRPGRRPAAGGAGRE